MVANQSTDNDQLLAARLRNGEHKAFEELYAAYHQLLFSVACKYLKNPTVAEDAVHETFVKLWENRHSIEPAQGVRNFMFKCLKFHVLNLIRNHKRSLVKQYEILYNTTEAHSDPEKAVIYNDYRKVVNAAVEKLSTQRRNIFRMRVVEGLTNEEVATRLGISINTVKFQFAQASKLLRNTIRIITSAFMF
jgi:RNA polymerase sigma-70 factor (family 1)